jgi:polysaccharide biosynthesis/export protein
MKTSSFLSWAVMLALVASVSSGCRNRGPEFNPYDTAAVVGELETETMLRQPDPSLLEPPREPFRLGPGDELEIEIVGEPETMTLTRVGPDGKIYFGLLPGLDVWGLTLSEAKNLIEVEYGRFTRERPHVGVTLRGVGSQRIWILGRVQAPGVYPIEAPVTLLEALAMAGGTLTHREQNIQLADLALELADLQRSFVIRNGEVLPVNFERLLSHGDPSHNIYLLSDDFVYLPAAAAAEVYVIGAVGSPRIVPYWEELTLAGAIAHAADILPNDAYLGQIAIVRGSFAEPQLAVVDFHRIRTGKAPDIPLQPRDIVYVPYAPYRHLRRYLDLVLNTFVTTVAINEGARAVVRDPPPPTGILIPFGGGTIVVPSGP